MSAMGVKIEQFDHPVCNSFQAKILNDQLCYEVDLNSYSDKNNIAQELGLGLNFFMDYNEDRKVNFYQNIENERIGLSSSMVHAQPHKHASIYLDTIGKTYLVHYIFINFNKWWFPETLKLVGEAEYNLNVLKEITATTSYLELDQTVRKCQNEEPLFNCTTRKYRETSLEECGCLPQSIRLSPHEVITYKIL